MKKLSVLTFVFCFQYSLQDCPEEISQNGLIVTWKQTSNTLNVTSEPVCYHKKQILTRNCIDGVWTPKLNELKPCEKVVNEFNLTSCPPGFHKVSEKNNDYCYKINSPAAWDYPCLSSGGAFIIPQLNKKDINTIINSLIARNISRYFWLPGKRQKLFNPVVWMIPGPNWARQVTNTGKLMFQNVFWKNCLALDLRNRMLVTESCVEKYPSVCFYINNLHKPATCPQNYYVFRYKSDDGICYGIEYANATQRWSYDIFLNNKCKNPMYGDSSLNRFIFTKIADMNKLPENVWCWSKASKRFDNNHLSMLHNETLSELEGVINKVGTFGIANVSATFTCMACEKEVIYGKTELVFQYDETENKIFLTIYFPSGLWRYNNKDKGVRCFSDAKGFGRAIYINNLPYMLVKTNKMDGYKEIEKIVYEIDLVTDRSAQYWCEGHTFNFSLITTDKIIINPNAKEMHVFSLTLNYYNITNELKDLPDLKKLLQQLTISLSANKVLLMDIYDVTFNYITVLLHVHVNILDTFNDKGKNILDTYNQLKNRSEYYLPMFNCTFINLTSSLYCLPCTTNGDIYLEWDLTDIGHASAPKQFCLQSNGLPVRRKCKGTYLTGGRWGSIEGVCDTNYVPSNVTTLLYHILRGHTPIHYITKFITVTLNYILSDVKPIIPADIYYISMSLRQFVSIAEENITNVDLGNIDNIAWIMNRMMDLDCEYLRLAQTLNSTNVIINSLDNLLELIAKHTVNQSTINSSYTRNQKSFEAFNKSYQLAVKPQFIVQISYPKVNNVSGIAISKVYKNGTFVDLAVHTLYPNTTINDVLFIDNLEIATWVPSKLLNVLKRNSNGTNNSTNLNDDDDDLHIIISIYKNDAVFPELINSNHVINSRIIGVSIPGYDNNLKYPLPIVFRQLKNTTSNKYCGFWDFQSVTSSELSGLWKTKGCYPYLLKLHELVVCECYHLTHFSQLINLPIINRELDQNMSIKHTRALNVITLVGCSLSVMGIIGIWVTACVFSNWRKKAGTKVLLQLSASIALPLVLIIISNLDNSMFELQDDVYVIVEHMKPACITMGALLHYSILSSFMWMLITAVLQFFRYVQVLGVSRPSRFLFKFGIIGWGIPLIPVVIVLIIDTEGYIPTSSMFKSICYPTGYYFIVSVMVPICIILLVNVVLFVSVLHSISRGPNDTLKSSDMDLVGAQLRLSIFLFFLLGLTWIFGIFSFSKSLIWSYLFCLTATLQGFVLFIYFIVCDPTTRNMWITLVKPPISAATSRNSITSLN